MFYITDQLWIEEDTVSEKFVLGSGPGGQHVNKNATAVQLRFEIHRATTLPEAVRERLFRIARNRITEDGTLVLHVNEYRSQHRNREMAWQRLAELIRKATEKPKPRKATKPSKMAKAKRMDQKRQRGQIKSLRQTKPRVDD